jgi:Flp pilus assembly protein TadD/TolB-like protein
LVLAVVGWWVYRQRQIAAEMGRQVAVLPFVVVGNSEGYRVIADGLLEVLTSAISDSERFHGRITAVPASEIRARGIKSPSDARRIYGVDLAIAGSVQPGMADKLQFSLALIDTAKLKQVGTVRFEYDPTRPIQSRDAAVVALARMLDLDLTEEVKEFVATGDSAVPGAYSAYLEATGLLSRYDVPGNADKAIVSLKRAVELDPKYALAYAGLAEAYWRKAQSAGSRQDLVALAMENAARGVELGPNLAVTHAVEGQIFGAFGREQEAVAELTKAVEIAPGSPDALRGLARVLANLGRYDEAEALYRKAIRLRPLDWYGHQLLGVLLMQEERYGDAEPAFRRARELSPNNLLVRRSLGLLYYNQGRYAEAIQQLTFPGASETAFSLELLAAAYHHEHRFKDAIEATNRAIALTPATAELWGNLAIFYKWDSDTESQYLPTLRKAVALTAETLKASPGDYHSRANMAEYLARLGDKRGAAAEIDKIPESARKPFAVPLATAYELSGRRADAIAMIRAQVSNPATLSQIKDDPDLAGLWADPALQSAIRAPSPTN